MKVQTIYTNYRNQNFGMKLKIRTPQEEKALRKSKDSFLSEFSAKSAARVLNSSPIIKANFEKLQGIVGEIEPKDVELVAERPDWLVSSKGRFVYSLQGQRGDVAMRQAIDLEKADEKDLKDFATEIKKHYDFWSKKNVL